MEKRRGATLLRTPDPAASPLLILAHEGKGRVAMLMSDQFWLWARGALAHDAAMQGPAAALLGRTVHWLLGDPSLAASQLHASLAHGKLAIRRVGSHGPAGTVTVTAPDGKNTTMTLHRAAPGRFEATMPAKGAGVWRVSAGDQTAFAGAANDDPAELADLAASDRMVAPLAHRSGGRVVWLGRDPAPSWTGLYRDRYAALVTGARERPLPPAIPGAILGFLLLAVAWWRERG